MSSIYLVLPFSVKATTTLTTTADFSVSRFWWQDLEYEKETVAEDAEDATENIYFLEFATDPVSENGAGMLHISMMVITFIFVIH